MQALLWFAVVVALFVPQSPPEDVFQKTIERELRKLDPWIVGELQQDYTEPKSVHAGLRKLNLEKLRELRKEGLLGFAAFYNRETDELVIPDNIGEPITADAVDHEAWHCLYDSVGAKGLIFSEDYRGPSVEEIAKFTEAKVGGQEFQKFVEHFNVARDQQHLMMLLGSTLNHAKEAEASLAIIGEVQKYVKAHAELETFMDPAAREGVNKSLENWRTRLEECRRVFSELAVLSQKWQQDSNKGEIQKQDLDEMRKQLLAFGQRMAGFGGYVKEARAFEKQVRDLYNVAEDAKYDKELRELDEKIKEEKNPERLEAFRTMRESLIELRQLLVDSRDCDKALDSLKAFNDINLGDIFPTIVYVVNSLKISEIFGNPDEVMARVVDSLYSLYYGPVSQNKFPLTEEDLAFLGRFTLRGEPLFRKGLEKYRVGQELIREGLSPEEVKVELEYATSFTHAGKTYTWPEANFTIRGAIPETKFGEK